LGPRATHQVNAVFEGGDIFPSGHVSNAVVLYGVIAMLAVSHRRLITAFAVFASVTVGLSTIYLDTHWMTDVLGGWLAGALVLIVLPWVMPYTERIADVVIRRARGVLAARRSVVPPPRPALKPVIVDRTAAGGPRGSRLATGRPNAQPGAGPRPAVAARPGAQA
jgi:membrane-associated phospholipid phosphatase